MSSFPTEFMHALQQVGPIMIGFLLLLFLAKPMFAPRSRQYDSVTLDPKKEPRIYDFVDKISRVVGAPAPTRIEVSCEPNAGVALDYRSGLFYHIIMGDPVLTIGLPLVSGLNIRQFAALLGHELGHYSQTTGLRLILMIDSVNDWFNRVIHERDAWDKQMADACNHGALPIRPILWTARFFIWLTRRLLWVLLSAGQIASARVSRQQEYHADMHGIRLAGSEAFESAALRIELLNSAFGKTLNDLEYLLQEARLTDDLPAQIAANADNFSQEKIERIKTRLMSGVTGRFAQHPAPKDAIEKARQENAAGVFQLDCPAKILLLDYPATARIASLLFYRGYLGNDIDEATIIPASQVFDESKETREDIEAGAEFFRCFWTTNYPPVFDKITLKRPDNHMTVAKQLLAARKAICKSAPQAAKAIELHVEIESKIRHVSAIPRRIEAGLPIDFADGNISSFERRDLETKRMVLQAEQDQVGKDIETYLEPVRARLIHALHLLYDKNVRSKMAAKPPELWEVQKLLDALAALGRALPTAREIQRIKYTLGDILQEDAESDLAKKRLSATMDITRQGIAHLEKIQKILQGHPYPFGANKSKLSLAQYIVGKIERTDQDMLSFQFTTMQNDFYRVYLRLLGKLARAALNVETTIGLAPLKPKPHKEK